LNKKLTKKNSASFFSILALTFQICDDIIIAY
jgi:hypothetical protein